MVPPRLRSSELIQSLQDTTRELGDRVDFSFVPLDRGRIWECPPDAGWSIGECFEHLCITSELYFPRIESGIEEALFRGLGAQTYFTPGLVGNLAVRTTRPANGIIRYGIRTLKALDPQVNRSDRNDAIQRFQGLQLQLLELLNAATEVDLGAIRIKSALGNVLRLKLGDALRFLVAHNERHVLQAERILTQMDVSEARQDAIE